MPTPWDVWLLTLPRRMCGLPGNDYKGTAAYLTECGYPTKENDLKNAKRSSKGPVEHAFAADDAVMEFIQAMLRKFPEFEWQRMISAQPSPTAATLAAD